MNMRPHFLHLAAGRTTLAISMAVSLLLAAKAFADPLRATTWCLQPKAISQTNAPGESQEARIQKTADVLRNLDADVIFLQNVPDWQSCHALIKALHPANYQLAVCSSFREPKTGALIRQQVAILSKAKPYLSWSEAWKNQNDAPALPAGFAFAAIRIGNKNAAFFSVEMPDALTPSTGGAKSVPQLLRQVAALRNWTANRIDAVVVAGDFGVNMDDKQAGGSQTLRLLDDAGLANVFLNVPANQRNTFSGDARSPATTRDYIFAKNAGLTAVPKVTTTDWSEHYAVSCELDLTAPKPMPAIVSVTTPVARADSPVKNPVPMAVQTNRAPTPAPVAHTEPPAKISEPVIIQSNQATTPASVPAAIPKPPPAAAPVLATQSVVPPIPEYNIWLWAGSMAGGLLLVLVIWRVTRKTRPRPAATTLLAMNAESGASISLPGDAERIVVTHRPSEKSEYASRQPIIHIETAGSSHTQSQMWQRRAEEAEHRAEHATTVMRAGLMPHLVRWLKDKLMRKLVSDRAQLMEVQRAATLKLLAVDDRLSKIESQLQQRDRDYERRIDELMNELAVAKEENRELIRAKIAVVKAEMEREKARMAQKSEAGERS